jgi:hypothetical protein
VDRWEPLADAPVLFADAPEDRPIGEGEPLWSWWSTNPEPARILDVTCRVPAEGAPFHELVVCRDLEWTRVEVAASGRLIPLPLHVPFLLRKYVLLEGSVPASEGALFPLELDADTSMLCVFGFQVPAGADAPEPIPPSACNDDGFMPCSDQSHPAGPLRVVIALELICEKVCRDLDPWGLLRGARLRPHLLVRADRPLEHAAATLRVRRTPSTVMIGCFADLEGQYRALAEERMGSTLVSFADRAPLPERLDWDALFAAVAVDGATAGLTTAADPDRPDRRGAFDGLLISPRLRAPEPLAAALPGYRLRDIVPAPVGEHDALHVFWRFPERFGHRPRFAGWSADLGPHRAPGAPMIPPNQRVSVRADGDGGFTYDATVQAPIAPDGWQVLMHHGMVFGLEVDHGRSAPAADCPPALRASREAWRFHWEQRYRLHGGGIAERLTGSRAG